MTIKSRPSKSNPTVGASGLDSTHLPVGPEPPWLSFTDWWGPRVPGHLLPPRARASVPESGQRRGQCKVTSVVTFKRLPLHAINARRATAPEVAVVSSITCSARPWQQLVPVSCFAKVRCNLVPLGYKKPSSPSLASFKHPLSFTLLLCAWSSSVHKNTQNHHCWPTRSSTTPVLQWLDRKSTRLNSSHNVASRMPSSA